MGDTDTDHSQGNAQAWKSSQAPPSLESIGFEYFNPQQSQPFPVFCGCLGCDGPKLCSVTGTCRGCCSTNDKSQLTFGKLGLRVCIPAQPGQGDAISLGISIPAKKTW